jgi:transposase
VSRLDYRLEPEGEVRRFEVINGTLGRRRWSADDRARILEETLGPGAVVSAVARRYALSPQQLFAWRRAARLPLAGSPAPEPLFVPAVVAEPKWVPAPKRPTTQRKRKAACGPGVIELVIDGVAMRIGRDADARTVAAVIRALKGAS